jgi:hypothetical protein
MKNNVKYYNINYKKYKYKIKNHKEIKLKNNHNL